MLQNSNVNFKNLTKENLAITYKESNLIMLNMNWQKNVAIFVSWSLNYVLTLKSLF